MGAMKTVCTGLALVYLSTACMLFILAPDMDMWRQSMAWGVGGLLGVLGLAFLGVAVLIRWVRL